MRPAGVRPETGWLRSGVWVNLVAVLANHASAGARVALLLMDSSPKTDTINSSTTARKSAQPEGRINELYGVRRPARASSDQKPRT